MRWFCTNCSRPVDVSEVRYRGACEGDYVHNDCEHQVASTDRVLVVGRSNIELSDNGMFIVNSPDTPAKIYPFEKFWRAVERAVVEELPDGWDGDQLIYQLKKEKPC